MREGSSLVLAAVTAALLIQGCGEGDARLDGAPEDRVPEEQRGRRWRKAPPNAPQLTDEQQRILDELNALGYAGGVREAPEVVSVTRYDRERAETGLNFYTSGHATEAYLIDMRGELVHRWSYDYDRLWPDHDVPEGARGKNMWRRAHLFEDGSILAVHAGIGMIKLDRDSNLLWEYTGRTHHDVRVTPDGTIWTLTREARIIPHLDPEVPCMDDFIVALNPDGTEQRRVSVLAALENGDKRRLLEQMNRRKDLFHTNSIELLDGRGAERVPAFAAGNVLISMRVLNAIAVVDLEQEKVVWSMSGDFVAQHDPRILENGNLLLFDNRGREGASTVHEFDLATREAVWTYRGSADEPFFSKTCGTSYRLPGGNTLINESDGGRSFEVTPEGAIVWEFFNPHRAGPNGELIAAIYDLQRVPLDLAWTPTGDPPR